jgi:acyl-CoA thioester hydrolase
VDLVSGPAATRPTDAQAGGEVVLQPCSEISIRFQDCDPFGHLNNARYLDYFINAREDHLAHSHGLDIYARQQATGENWVVVEHRIAYLAPVRFREKVRIRTCLLDFGPRDLHMEGLMLGQAEDAPRALLWTKFAYFSLAQGRSLPHPPDILAFLAGIRLPGGRPNARASRGAWPR